MATTQAKDGGVASLFGCLLLLLAASLPLATASVFFIPTSFLTKDVYHAKPDQTIIYTTSICRPLLYRGYMATVHVQILPAWDPAQGALARIDACRDAQCTMLLDTNFPADAFNGLPFAKFMYDVVYGNFFIRVTSPGDRDIPWTVRVDFTPINSVHPAWNIHHRTTIVQVQPRPSRHPVVILHQVVTSANPIEIHKAQPMFYRISFCPNEVTTRNYEIYISVTGLDLKSSFSSYVCLPRDLPCSPQTSKIYDLSHSTTQIFNLATTTGSLFDLYLNVLGHGELNRVVIGAVMKIDFIE